MYSEIKNVSVMGISAAVPSHFIDNLSFGDIFGIKEVEKQMKLTGIRNRHCLQEDQSLQELNISAIDELINRIGWRGEELEFIIYVSAYYFRGSPANAYTLADYLNAGEGCLCYDVNLGCSSFTNGLYMGASFLQSLDYGSKGLVVVADGATTGGDHSDKTTVMLSGDCTTVIALEKREDASVLQFDQCFEGDKYQAIHRYDYEHNMQMDGMSVFEFVIKDVAEAIDNYFKHYNMERDSIDYFLLHQGQKFIVQKVAHFSALPKEKVLTSYELYGNTGGPSVPCTLCANIDKIRKETDKESMKMFFAGYGSGLAYGFVVANINLDTVCPVIMV